MNTNPSSGSAAKYTWSEVERVDPPKRPITRRVADFEQASGLYDAETAQLQASRCVQCPNPNCVTSCPLCAPLPDLLALTAEGRFHDAAQLFFTTHSIPELAAHTCVGGRQCERACVLVAKSEPVPIRAITRFLLDYGWNHGLAEPLPAAPTGRRVAVIGSGIGGLVAAETLSRRGHAVTVLDSRCIAGGRMMNGLPGFRVDTRLVSRRVQSLKTRGVQFRMGLRFGDDVKLSDLRQQFDAVFIAFGRADPVGFDVPGIHLNGIFQALPLLLQAQAGGRSDKAPLRSIDVKGRRVVVLGGGDTAMDTLRTAIRRGAANVLCIYRRDLSNLPADAEEYANAVEEGACFEFLSQPVAMIGDANGAVTHVRCVRTELAEPDGAGRLNVRLTTEPEFDVPADVVLVAFGFTAPRLPNSDDFAALALDEHGRVAIDANWMTNLPKVFAGGAIVRGPVPLSDVVRDSRDAAIAIDSRLR